MSELKQNFHQQPPKSNKLGHDTLVIPPDVTCVPLLRRMVQTIEHHAMMSPGERILAGVSGGPDSVALIHMLETLAPANRLQLAVAHLNHGIRPGTAEQEAEFVQKLAQDLGLRFHLKKIRLNVQKGSLEERARMERYTFFHHLAQKYGYTKIALGHHADDNAEAVLQHLLRGSGIRGLAGIPPKRDELIVRPLINLYRSEIMSYLRKCRLSFMEDASNEDLRFERNRIRGHLIPMIQKHFNPNIAATLHRMADLCREEDNWLQSYLEPQLVQIMENASTTGLDLRVPALNESPLAVKRRLIRDALRQWRGDLQGVGAGHIEAVIGLLPSHREGKLLNLPGRIKVARTASHLRFTCHRDEDHLSRPVHRGYCVTVPFPKKLPMEVEIAEAGCRLKFSAQKPGSIDKRSMTEEKSTCFDLDGIKFPLTIRNFQTGDRLAPFGLAGTQKLKKLFIDRKIPRTERHRIPLLISGGTILWVVGVRRGNAAALSASSTNALCIEVL